MKKQNGITLIALVITIIVLLILAGVSIATLSGENGIVKKAQDASEKTKIAEEDELETLSGLEDLINSSTENLEPSEPDATFPYGTLYSANLHGTTDGGIVVYDNGVVELMYIIDNTEKLILLTTGTGQAAIEGNILKVADIGDIVISEDYSTLTYKNNGTDEVYNRTTTIFTYCSHQWESNNGSKHQCLKCQSNGLHSNVNLDGCGECTECNYVRNHTWTYTDETYHNCSTCLDSNEHNTMDFGEAGHGCSECDYIVPHELDDNGYCEVCGFSCNHTINTTSVDNENGTHTIEESCSSCTYQSSYTENHSYNSPNYTDNGDGTHNYEKSCDICFSTVSDDNQAHFDDDADDMCDGCGATMES